MGGPRRSLLSTELGRHIDLPVDREGDQPEPHLERAARSMMPDNAVVKWIDVSGHGYEKDWMWVIGY